MIQNDPFSSVRIKKNQPTLETSQAAEQPKGSDPFENVRIKKAEGPSFLYETGRHAARLGSRIAETIGGIPGDINSLIESGVFAGLEKLTGIKPSEEVRKRRKEIAPSFPTTGELKEFSEKATKGFTAPQGDIEKGIDEFATLAASLVGPMKFRKALGVAAGSQLAKEGIKLTGFGEGSQEAGKLGTMFLLSMYNPSGALKYASSQYEKANSLAKGASIAAPQFKSNLTNFVNDLKKGVTTSSKSAVLKPAEELLEKVKSGKILVQDLTAAKRDLNTIMKDPALLKREKKLLKVVSKEIDNAINPYEKLNPAFKKAYRPANEIYGAVMQGTKASDFISKTLGAKSVLGAAVGETILGHPEFVLPTIAGGLGAIGVAKGADFFMRIAKSPELQKFYARAMSAALLEDAPSLRLYADKIENIINKD